MSDESEDAPADASVDVADLAKKSGIVWIQALDRTWPVWSEWIGEAICVVGSVRGEGEQPIPDLPDGSIVTVLLRAKADRALAASVEARLEIIGPDAEAWDGTTAALKSGRLNLPDSDGAIERWARTCRVLRLVPLDATPAEELPDAVERTLPQLS